MHARAQHILVCRVDGEGRPRNRSLHERLQRHRTGALLRRNLKSCDATCLRLRAVVKTRHHTHTARRKSQACGLEQQRPTHLYRINPAQNHLPIRAVSAIHHQATGAEAQVSTQSRIGPHRCIDRRFIEQLTENRGLRSRQKEWIGRKIKLGRDAVAEKVLGYKGHRLMLAANCYVVGKRAIDRCTETEGREVQTSIRFIQRMHRRFGARQRQGSTDGAICGPRLVRHLCRSLAPRCARLRSNIVHRDSLC